MELNPFRNYRSNTDRHMWSIEDAIEYELDTRGPIKLSNLVRLVHMKYNHLEMHVRVVVTALLEEDRLSVIDGTAMLHTPRVMPVNVTQMQLHLA